MLDKFIYAAWSLERLRNSRARSFFFRVKLSKPIPFSFPVEL